MHKLTLIQRAIILFPRRSYIPEGAVRHARREYCKAVEYLRNCPRWAALYDESQLQPREPANQWDTFLK